MRESRTLPLVQTRPCELCSGEMLMVTEGGLFGMRYERWRCTRCTREAGMTIYQRFDENTASNGTRRDTSGLNLSGR